MMELEQVHDGEVVQGGYIYDERGLPVFTETDYESAVSEVARLRAQDMETRLHLAAVLAAVSADRVYGESSLKEFAAEVGVGYAVAQKLVQAYRRISDLNQNSGEQVVHAITTGAISTTHVNIAASVEDDEEFMSLMDEAQNMTTARFGARVKEQRGELSPLERQRREERAARRRGVGCRYCNGISIQECPYCDRWGRLPSNPTDEEMAQRHQRVLAQRTRKMAEAVRYAGRYAEALRRLPEAEVRVDFFEGKPLAQLMRETGEALIAFADEQERGGDQA